LARQEGGLAACFSSRRFDGSIIYVNPPSPATVAAGDICLFGVKLTQDEAIHFEDLEFITDRSDNLSPTPEGATLAL
jgi:hypothetical protein